MSWSSEGDAITLEKDTGLVSFATTSTSTVLGTTTEGEVCLRMFGIGQGPLSSVDVGPAPSDTGEVEQGTGNIGYIQSTSADPSTATAADLRFELVSYTISGVAPMTLTCIPSGKSGKVLDDGSGNKVSCEVVYKDVHVVALPDGAGWLMTMARYHRPSAEGVFGTGNLGPSPDNCFSAVVAYWAPTDDATFTSPSVRGPFWLVGRMHDIDGETLPLWLGMPAVAVVDEDGEYVVYVYYTAEPSRYGDDAGITEGVQGGTRLRKISYEVLAAIIGVAEGEPAGGGTSDASTVETNLDWVKVRYDITTGVTAGAIASSIGLSNAWSHTATGALGYAARKGSARVSGYTVSERLLPDPSEGWFGRDRVGRDTTTGDVDTLGEAWTWTEEESWDSLTGAGLVPGYSIGMVRVWVGTGTEFADDEDPGDELSGNDRFEEYYILVYIVDAVPVVCAEGLVLFFSANYYDGGTGTEARGWGIWRAAAIPPRVGVDVEYGLDFVVHTDECEVEDRQDLLAPVDEFEPDGDPVFRRVDPDPVELPDGTWVVFAGTTAGDPLARFEGSAEDVCRPASEAWS